MRHRIAVFIFSALFISGLTAQNWHCVSAGKTRLYSSDGNRYRAARIDSVAGQNESQVYYFFKSMKQGEPGSTCFLPDTSSWLGRAMITDPGGDDRFVTFDFDTITIKINASVSDSWVLFRHTSPGNYVLANISGIQVQSVLGDMDSVKTIHLQAMDSLNNPIQDPINNYYLELSRNHGLITAFSFCNFPYLSQYGEVMYHLAGETDTDLGNQNLILRDVYDFEVGDVYQTYYEYYRQDYLSGYSTTEKQISTLVKKNMYPGGDSVTYTFFRASRRPDSFCSSPPCIRFDTVVVTYNFLSSYNHPYPYGMTEVADCRQYLDLLPDESQYAGSYYRATPEQFSNNMYNGRMQKEVVFYSKHNPDCFEKSTDEFAPLSTIPQYRFIKGCGGPYFTSHYDVGEGSARIRGTDTDSLVYYNKGSESWGIPFDTTGWKMPLSVPLGKSVGVTFTISPNPCTENVDISVIGNGHRSLRLLVYSVQGVVIDEFVISSMELQIPVSKYEKGVYLLRLFDGIKLTAQHKLIKM